MKPTVQTVQKAPRGVLYLVHGCALVVGPGIDSTPHAHFAMQLTLGVEGPFRARLGDTDAWIETQAALFAPNQPHQLDCGGRMLAHLFVEPPQRDKSVTTRIDAGFSAQPQFGQVVDAIAAARAGTLDIEAAGRAMQLWLACALPAQGRPLEPQPDRAATVGFDARIAKALEWIAAHPGVECSGAQLAAQVHLSESRFTHLFRQQTGLSLSRYLLWARLVNAVAAVGRGENMTQAAHHAGFADLAHMSRSFRASFGVVPSELQKMTIAFKPAGRQGPKMTA